MQVERHDEAVTITLESLADTDRFAAAVAEIARPGLVIGLVGTLGAGKTTWTRAFARALNIPEGEVSSPTFVLIHEYQGNLPVYHFDTYRLQDPADFERLGPWEYFERDGVCLVEWADRVADLLPDDTLWLRFAVVGPSSRVVTVECPGDPERLDRLAGFDDESSQS